MPSLEKAKLEDSVSFLALVVVIKVISAKLSFLRGGFNVLTGGRNRAIDNQDFYSLLRPCFGYDISRQQGLQLLLRWRGV